MNWDSLMRRNVGFFPTNILWNGSVEQLLSLENNTSLVLSCVVKVTARAPWVLPGDNNFGFVVLVIVWSLESC